MNCTAKEVLPLNGQTGQKNGIATVTSIAMTDPLSNGRTVAGNGTGRAVAIATMALP
jgi:hypothetical protein